MRSRYVRTGWRQVREGDRVKDPRGERVIVFAAWWGYRTEGMIGLESWPRVGRLKIVQTMTKET